MVRQWKMFKKTRRESMNNGKRRKGRDRKKDMKEEKRWRSSDCCERNEKVTKIIEIKEKASWKKEKGKKVYYHKLSFASPLTRSKFLYQLLLKRNPKMTTTAGDWRFILTLITATSTTASWGPNVTTTTTSFFNNPQVLMCQPQADLFFVFASIKLTKTGWSYTCACFHFMSEERIPWLRGIEFSLVHVKGNEGRTFTTGTRRCSYGVWRYSGDPKELHIFFFIYKNQFLMHDFFFLK